MILSSDPGRSSFISLVSLVLSLFLSFRLLIFATRTLINGSWEVLFQSDGQTIIIILPKKLLIDVNAPGFCYYSIRNVICVPSCLRNLPKTTGLEHCLIFCPLSKGIRVHSSEAFINQILVFFKVLKDTSRLAIIIWNILSYKDQ